MRHSTTQPSIPKQRPHCQEQYTRHVERIPATRSLTGAVLCLGVFLAPIALGQFVPDKPVVIHPAVESTPVRKGAIKGPGAGLGYTTPAPPQPRRPFTRRPRPQAAPPPEPPPAPEIPAAAQAIEQTSQGKRPAIEPEFAFDGLGEGFTARALPEASQPGNPTPGSASRGGIYISLAVGPDHIIEILNGNMAVFTKKGKKYPSTGKLLYGPVPNNTVFAGFGERCSVSNNADSEVRYDQLAKRWLIVVPVFTRPPDNSQ